MSAGQITQNQCLAVTHGFKYWRAEDAHGVKGTTQQAIRLLQELIGVEVQIDDEHDEGCRECGPMHEAMGKAFEQSQKDQEELFRLRAEVQRLTSEQSIRACECSPDEACAHVRRAEAAEREVQRLTEEARRLRAELDQCDRPEFPVKMSPDGVARLRVSQYWVERVGGREFIWVDADEVRRKLPLTEESRRSDAGRVEVPELTAEIVAQMNRKCVGHRDLGHSLAFEMYRWFKANARLSPSPQPATGAVVLPEITDEERRMLSDKFPESYAFHDLAEAIYDLIRSKLGNPSPQPSADVVGPREEWEAIASAPVGRWLVVRNANRTVFEARKHDAHSPWLDRDGLYREPMQWNALRSSTNHDAQDAGEGR